MERLELLTYWIKERENIRKCKEAGFPKPWSVDWVFQQTYFCNVHREDDTVTKWIRTNWGRANEPNFEFAMCFARLFNYIPTLELVEFPEKHPWIEEAIGKIVERSFAKEKVWGNAYVVTTHGIPTSKLEYALRMLNDIAVQSHGLHNEIRRCDYLEEAHEIILRFEGYGSFMAAQVVADIKNTEGHPLQNAKDWWTWSAMGPGSMRGLKWVYGRTIRPAEYASIMEDLHPKVEALTAPIKMCAQDLQNCLCEFDKYMRVKSATGRSKRGYPGR
jgi:hypothetical protein